MMVKGIILLSIDKDREGKEIEIHWDADNPELERWTIEAERLERNGEVDYDIDEG